MPTYTCEACGHRFAQKGHFEAHQRMKTPCNLPDLQERPYKCPAHGCDRRYTSVANRNKHACKCPLKLTADARKEAAKLLEGFAKFEKVCSKVPVLERQRDGARDLAHQLRALMDKAPGGEPAAAAAFTAEQLPLVALKRFEFEDLDYLQETDPDQLCKSLHLVGTNAVYSYLPAMAELIWGRAAAPENYTVYMSDRMPGEALVAERRTNKWMLLNQDAVLGRCIEAVVSHRWTIESQLRKAMSPAKIDGLFDDFDDLEGHISEADLPRTPRTGWPQALQLAAKAVEHVLVKACRDRPKPEVGRIPLPPPPKPEPPPPEEEEATPEESGSVADQYNLCSISEVEDAELYSNRHNTDPTEAVDDGPDETIVLSID